MINDVSQWCLYIIFAGMVQWEGRVFTHALCFIIIINNCFEIRGRIQIPASSSNFYKHSALTEIKHDWWKLTKCSDNYKLWLLVITLWLYKYSEVMSKVTLKLDCNETWEQWRSFSQYSCLLWSSFMQLWTAECLEESIPYEWGQSIVWNVKLVHLWYN